MMSPEDQFVQDILKRLSRNYYDRLIFAGIIDDKAKLIHFQKGQSVFRLQMQRQIALDVQIALVSSLARQFEDFAGPAVHSILSYDNCEVIIMNLLKDSVLYVICNKGASGEIADMLTKMIEDGPEKILPVGQKPDFTEDEWAGQ